MTEYSTNSENDTHTLFIQEGTALTHRSLVMSHKSDIIINSKHTVFTRSEYNVMTTVRYTRADLVYDRSIVIPGLMRAVRPKVLCEIWAWLSTWRFIM